MSTSWDKQFSTETSASLETQEFSANYNINRKIKSSYKRLRPYVKKLFLELASDTDKEILADYLDLCIRQENIKLATVRGCILAFGYLCRYLKPKKSFKDMRLTDLNSFLDILRKDRNVDPDQSWINTQRSYGLTYLKFFKWLAYPDLTAPERKHMPREKLPEVIKGLVIPIEKGSKSPIKAKDIWYDQDNAVFLK